MSDLLLATKTRVPPLRKQLVDRPDLLRGLNQAISKHNNLTLISAPAGYGKSTLLAEWVAQLDCKHAWLTLEKGDNNPLRFWSYFAAALETIQPLSQGWMRRSEWEAQEAQDAGPGEVALGNLLNDLAVLDERVVLVLDDLHTITDGRIHDDLVFLVEHLPPNGLGLQLVVAGRIDPPWPLARLRARAQIFELRSKDLRFSLDETAEFLDQVMGLKLTEAQVSRLDQRTEGWVAGLQMAALSMKNREDISGFLDGFSGSHRYILDYLIEEVLNQQTPKMMDFLLKTSILDTLTGPLCDLVTGGQGGEETLIQLERSNTFLSCLDDERCWYRYHPLFRDLLRKRFSTSAPAQIPELHRLASGWYESNGYLREAVLQALEADDMREVARLVSGNILVLAEGRGLPELLEHIGSLKPQEIYSRPWLCIAVAWVKVYAGQLEEARVLLDELERVSVGQLPGEERSHLLGHALTIRAYCAWIKGEPDLAVDMSREALAMIPANDALERANILIILGLALQNCLKIEEANLALRQAVSCSIDAKNRYLQIYASSCLVFTLRLAGQLREAHDTCEHIIQVVDREQSMQGSFALAIGLAARSQVFGEWNDLHRALDDARDAVALAEQWSQVDTLHFSLSVLADTYLAMGNFEACQETIDRCKAIARRVSPWFMEISERQDAELALARGDWGKVLRWKDIALPRPKDGYSDYPVLCNILIAQDCLKEALDLLDPGILRLRDSGVWGAILDLYAFKAVVVERQGREREALSALEMALKMAEPEGYIRTIINKGDPMRRLLQRAAQRGIHKQYAQHLLDIMTDGSLMRSSSEKLEREKRGLAQEKIAEPLSDRELEVLRLLNTHLSVPEIAEELSVAPSTIRTHVRVIYGKLGVHGRLEAIHRGKELEFF